MDKLYLPKRLVSVRPEHMRNVCRAGDRVWFRYKDEEMRTGFYQYMGDNRDKFCILCIDGTFLKLKSLEKEWEIFIDPNKYPVERLRYISKSRLPQDIWEQVEHLFDTVHYNHAYQKRLRREKKLNEENSKDIGEDKSN